VVIEFEGRRPKVAPTAFVAPTAVLVGDVTIAEGASIWFGAVLRGDEGTIEIGARASVQDNVVIHCGPNMPTVVGDDVTVGHGAILEGCIVEPSALLGMGAVVLNFAIVGTGAIVAAGAVVPERTTVGAGTLAAGVPAREKRSLDDRGRDIVGAGSGEYQRLVARYRRGAVWEPNAAGIHTGLMAEQ
jgi:carbonic anhydrase/acetyltransferase-like protein (isoleucine patch superfamily)